LSFSNWNLWKGSGSLICLIVPIRLVQIACRKPLPTSGGVGR
jgi:hypothetical protein